MGGMFTPAAGFALLALLAFIVAGLFIRRIRFTTKMVLHAALLIALTIILHQIRIFHMPQGGSVTLGAMLPLLLLSFRYGPGVGMLAGFLYGCVSLIQDPFILHPVQVLFDYPLPYMAMGAAGLFPRRMAVGVALAFLLRFACHVISGVVFFASYAPEGTDPLVYSLLYNAGTLIPECIICGVLLKLLPIRRLLGAMRA